MGGDPALEEFEAHRARLFGIAYRMLGSAADADDVLQDAWLRWQAADRSAVQTPAAYLARTVTNLCLTALTSARARREVYVGPWLPEPVLTGPAGTDLGPLDHAEQRDSVSFALLTVVERLSPPERAAYVLREAFAYSAAEVAELIGTSEANVRQLHARARRRVSEAGAGAAPREADPARLRELVERFLDASRGGDLAALEALLSEDVVARADGGGVVSAGRRPVEGREKVARYVTGVVDRFAAGLQRVLVEVNGVPAVAFTDRTSLRAVLVVQTRDGRVSALDLVLNPDKLVHAERQLSRIGALPGREG
ncbi:RNA polymerase sigma-70 factor [Cellulomonas sp. NTE-D12]|uniref:RNA polymerase sigma-70 factor n=1 Tax=Cellulomonas sp. NTE-D12 TaxID=2962632 RepID=UPI003081F94D|nr:RNA polymerase sigma24 factor [Cellulomonas sp. NTE-D12]